MFRRRLTVGVALVATMLVGAVASVASADEPQDKSGLNREEGAMADPFQDVFELSLAEKKGLTVYVSSHAIPGIVTKLIGADAVELRSQQFAKIVVRRSEIVAVALH